MPYPYPDDENQLAPEIILGARQLRNPEGIAPRMDTEGPPPTRMPMGAKLEPIPTHSDAKMNIDNVDQAHAMEQPGVVREASAHNAPPEGNMVMNDAGIQPAPDTSALPASSHAAPETSQSKPELVPLDQSGLAGHALAQEGQTRHAAKLREFGDAEAHLNAGLLKSPDEFSNPTDYTKYLTAITAGRGALKQAKAEYELSHPWGAMESSHPGVFGKIGHAFGQIGNVAGEAFAPGLAEAIPGSHANLEGQVAEGEAGVKQAIGEQGAIAGGEQKTAAAEKAGEQAQTEESKRLKNTAEAGLADTKTTQMAPSVDKQVLAAGQRIAEGSGTDKDFALVDSFHKLQTMKREATMKNAPANIKAEYEQAVKDGDDAKASQLLDIAHKYATATQPPQRSPQELIATPPDAEGNSTLKVAREGTQIAPGSKSAKDVMKGATMDETRRADLSRNMNENMDQLEEIAKRRPDLFGPVAGRVTTAKEWIGTSDPDIGALHTIRENMGMAQVGAHAMRNAQHVETAANSIVNSFKNDANTVLNSIQKARTSLATFQQDAGEQPGSAPKNAPKTGKGKEIHYKIVNGKLVAQ